MFELMVTDMLDLMRSQSIKGFNELAFDSKQYILTNQKVAKIHKLTWTSARELNQGIQERNTAISGLDEYMPIYVSNIDTQLNAILFDQFR